MTNRLVIYALALVIGLTAALCVMPVAAILGTGAAWYPPGSDQAQTLTGHLAFQADGWRWPLLTAQNLFWPRGISIALTDSNPLMSLIAKVWTHATGTAPVNLLGWFMAGCWVLQPVCAVFAVRGLGVRGPAALAAGVLAAAWPALMIRMGHIDLCAHYLLFLALGLAIRRGPRPGTWWAPAGVMLVAVLTQPYLFQLAAVVLAAIPIHAALCRRPGWRREAILYLASGVVAAGTLMVLSGPLGGGDKGFVFFSMNLLGPIWPQRSGVFGPDLPIIDATGGQYEGFNWLGAGTMLLGLAALVGVARRPVPARPLLGLIVVLVLLTLIAPSSKVYAGSLKVLDLGTKPWEDIFGTFRTPGRMFWPVGYALMLFSVAGVARLPRPLAAPLLAAACVLQVIDVRPLWIEARTFWEQGSRIATPALPSGTTLFTAAPFPGCTPDPVIKADAPIMILDAMRHGARVGDIGLGRSPPWFSCELIPSDALELPLLPGEVRAYFGAPMQAALRPALLGREARCWRDRGVVVCGRTGSTMPGEPVAPGEMPVQPALPLTLTRDAMAPLLGFGWHIVDHVAWSEGERATLLLPVAPGGPLALTLHAEGVAVAAGGTREMRVTIGRVPAGSLALPDGRAADITVPIPAEATEDGLVRIAFDTIRAVDPTKRGMTAPVQRAAMKLTGLTLERR